jgi:hypothetical protein
MKRRTSTSGAAKGDTGHDRRQAIYDELIRARGGPAAFSTVQISVARTAVRMLARDDLDARDAGVLSELLRFLPPERTEPPLDMTKLPDAQFDAFCKSVAIMRGEALPPRTVRTQSPRWRDAKRLCAVLDGAQKRGKLLDDERVEIQNLVHCLLVPVIPIAYQLWPSPVAQKPQDATPAPAPAPSSPEPEAAAPVAENVVSLPQRPLSIHREAVPQ